MGLFGGTQRPSAASEKAEAIGSSLSQPALAFAVTAFHLVMHN